MPYAIIRTGGHQEKVSPGEQISIDRVKNEVGEEITFVPLAVTKADGTLVSDKKELSDSATVTATVLQHIKNDKIDVFQYRQKTGYRRHTGHRQPMTLVQIASIKLGDEVFTAPEPAAAPEPSQEPAGQEKPAKKAAAKKPAAKKPVAAAKKAAPKKPAAKKK